MISEAKLDFKEIFQKKTKQNTQKPFRVTLKSKGVAEKGKAGSVKLTPLPFQVVNFFNS